MRMYDIKINIFIILDKFPILYIDTNAQSFLSGVRSVKNDAGEEVTLFLLSNIFWSKLHAEKETYRHQIDTKAQLLKCLEDESLH